MEKDTGKICGHIVAGDTFSGLAYIVAIEPVLSEITESGYDVKTLVTTSHSTVEMPADAQVSSDLHPSSHVDLAEAQQQERAEPNATDRGQLALSLPRAGESFEVPTTPAQTARQLESVPEGEVAGAKNDTTCASTLHGSLVSSHGIAEEVIKADICQYLGHNSFVIPMGVSQVGNLAP